jgi:hypothetical protein
VGGEEGEDRGAGGGRLETVENKMTF